jgi:glycosyltransferase involved in cell wall biosynthesis
VLLPFLIVAELALFVRLLRDPQVRVIHAHWILPQGLAFALAKTVVPRDRRAPMSVLSLHSGRDETVSRLYGSLEKYILGRFDRITVNNEKTRRVLEQVHGRPIGYLSMALPKDAEAIALPPIKDYRSVASVGRLVGVKGYLELVREWARRKEALAGYSLVILGKGQLAGEIQALIQSQGLGERVRLHANPSRELILRTLSKAGYYLQPSVITASGHTEGFGLSAVEALHLGCTTVVTDVGGLPEVVGDAGYVCANAGEMLDGLLDGRLRPVEPNRCRERAHRFRWGSKDT